MSSSLATEDTVIICFGFSRPAHLDKTLRALSTNFEAKSLPLRVYVDGPRSESDQCLIDEVIAVARSYQERFLSFELRQSHGNKGLYTSITHGLSEALVDYSQAIVIEDDICVSPFFLEYMLEALAIYRDEKKVASIHGFTPPVKEILPETFFLRGADCWGWATWRDRWFDHFNSDANSLLEEIRSRGLIDEFNLSGGYNFYDLLRSQANGECQSWAICWHASCFVNGLLTLHPGRSLVKNIGLDGTGEHSVPSPAHQAIITDTHITCSKQKLEEIKDVVDIYSSHFKQYQSTDSFLRRIKSHIKSMGLQFLGMLTK